MDWLDFDLDKTVDELEYTRKATLDIDHIIGAEDYENRDAGMIYDYLMKKARTISFKDYLKRYIYVKAEFEEDFSEIEDEEYKDILKLSFEERKAPYSFRPTTRKKGKILNDFITSDHVSRETIFVLGFGLCMNDNDVSDFLTKVNLERSFDFQNPEEVVYWFCYRYEYSYSHARRLLKMYEDMEPDFSLPVDLWKEMYRSPGLYITSENELDIYLKAIRTYRDDILKENVLYDEFEKLYDRTREAIAKDYTRTNENGRVYTKEDIKAADIEKILCSGIPVTANGNLMKMSESSLSKKFLNKRMGRQRVSAIVRKMQPVERFDLITLLFIIYAITVEPDWPTERSLEYIEEGNKILSDCKMMGIYPMNPYEAFILMCLMSDCPLAVYADVLEKSYEELV